ncbi:hypothetical protein GCM10022198_10240 [Klugiella xanthotipulae]|uniref:PH (Pleckstrin Homology) domain-containing protein n=1 Tax=Klugiella xanthotipulae TaxID=244735 RepID=A0A543HYK9_9MICO|nr:PH domain-containing protein [Klugiella xanthotipulae]TQM63422.1 PH (Pleckstrin Homology) domain-containing protein [Klugiella xanthotipulae]
MASFSGNDSRQKSQDLSTALKPATAAHLRPEVIIARLRRHGRILTFHTLVLLAVPPLVGYFGFSLAEAWQRSLVIAGGGIVIFLLCVLPYFAWLGGTYTITTKRIVVRHGFFVRSRSEASIGRIREVRVRATAAQRMFGSGTVLLLVGSEDPLSLRDVPGSEQVVSMLHELMERSYAVDSALSPAQTPAGVTE